MELTKLKAIAESPNANQYRVGATSASVVLKLAAFGLEGEVLMAGGDLNGAIEAFSSGVAIEDQNNYTEPPDWAPAYAPLFGCCFLEGRPARKSGSCL